MMNVKKRWAGTLLLAILIGTMACDTNKNTQEPTPEANKHVLITRVGNADGTTYSFYGQTLGFSDESITGYDNTKATEISPQAYGVFTRFNKMLYFNNYGTGILEKWEQNTSGGLAKTGSATFTDMGFLSNVTFKDQTMGFIGGSNAFKIAIFNPVTLQRTGFIDMSKISRKAEVTNFPSQGDAIGVEAVSEMIIRDNMMYVSIFYFRDFQTYIPNVSSCEIVVIDLSKVNAASSDNSAAVVKRISDPRGSFTGAWNSGGGSYFMVLDEKNDIYVMCHNMWSIHRATTGKTSSVLRIKSGSTEFDKDYFFDLEKASGGSGAPVMGLEYAKNGKFFAAVQNPKAINPNDPYSGYLDPIHNWWQFDLYAQTAKLVTTDLSKGSSASKCYFEGDKSYIPFVNKTESYVLEVDVNTLSTKKKWKTNGDPFIYNLVN